MKRVTYTVVVEDAGGNLSAYVPDLPGCVSTGKTLEETVENIREAIQFHLDGLLEDGAPLPPASARSVDVAVEVAA